MDPGFRLDRADQRGWFLSPGRDARPAIVPTLSALWARQRIRQRLWTNGVLVAARGIHQSFGFTPADVERHHSYGHDLVGQN
ncbi:hypothetical protein GCM10010330_24810 [Streptomyces tendae]|nr:hypothetical protein GCM10010330_24810 [Streptomyces tendae]